MKYLLLFSFFIPYALFAQNASFCSYAVPPEGLVPLNYVEGAVNMTEPYVLNTYFLATTQVSDDFNLTEDVYLNGIAFLNRTFNAFNIFF